MNEIESTKPQEVVNAIPADSDFDAQPSGDISKPEQETTDAQEQTETAQDEAKPESTDEPTGIAEPYMSFNYNHEKVELGRDEAVDWAQKGMHYFNKLDFVAAVNGTTVDALLKGMVEDIDRKKRNELQEKFGDDSSLVDDLMTLFHNQNKEKYEKAKYERAQQNQLLHNSRTERMNTEFHELQKDFPELENLSDIPNEVLGAAEEMPLMVAYLLYRHREDRKIKAAQEASISAAVASTGSVASNTASNTDSTDSAFMKAFWR